MPHFFRSLLTLIISALAVWTVSGQSVGVVLSGGGASAMAHIGFLRCLEEHGVPIDYITGTSMGAVVGALYAAGYSVEEMESMARSPQFLEMATGELDESYRYYFQERDDDASIVKLRYSKGSFITNTLPGSLIDSHMFDFRLMEDLGAASAASGYNFDNLFVPFRCIAADIESKEQVIFKEGDLARAVRCSATYPFYIKPLEVDGKLLFDGGLYNNFPSDVLYNEFLPDIIIGCNVSENNPPPSSDDIISQIKSMIVQKTNFESLCEQMFIVEPQMDITTFEFERIDEAIQAGYLETLAHIDHILPSLERRVSQEELTLARMEFRALCPEVLIDRIEINGLESSQGHYVSNILGNSDRPVSLEELKRNYFRVFNDDKIKSLYPTLEYKPQLRSYTMRLDVERQKDIELSFGGNFSSRPVNTGFVGVKYNIFSRFASSLSANSYFGRFYGSASAAASFDISAGIPFSVEPQFVLNRWDYFRSLATFFEDVKPSFIIKNERFGAVNIRFPAGNNGRVESNFRWVHTNDDYYLNEDFTSVDTADQTVFDGFTFGLSYQRSTLNRISYASKGTFLRISSRFVEGEEKTIPGSTSLSRDTIRTNRDWMNIRLNLQTYLEPWGILRVGFVADGVISTQPFFNNRIASLMRAPAFEPFPESRTLFLPQFRAHNFAAGGIVAVWGISKSFDLRTEAHVFRPFGAILGDESGKPYYDWSAKEFFMGSAALVLHSPIGPISVSLNYYEQRQDPWTFIFNFGHILFNRQAFD